MMKVSTDKKIMEMREWCEEQGVTLTLEGECGFGRECVGVLAGDHYVETQWSGHNEYPEQYVARCKNGHEWDCTGDVDFQRPGTSEEHRCPVCDAAREGITGMACPPRDLAPYNARTGHSNAYHKADVLAVLGREEPAINELYEWIAALKRRGGRVSIERRREIPGTPGMLALAMHGATTAIMRFPGYEPPEDADERADAAYAACLRGGRL